MPDVWTTRKDHLKEFLIELGARCEVEPRVLKPRDPEWTCHVNGAGWIGDIYIHDVNALWSVPLVLQLGFVTLLTGLLAGIWLERLTSKIHRK